MNGSPDSSVTTRLLSVDTDRTINGRKIVMPSVANACRNQNRLSSHTRRLRSAWCHKVECATGELSVSLRMTRMSHSFCASLNHGAFAGVSGR